MRVLAFDPGKDNFAYALLDDERCVRHGFVPTVTSLAHFSHIDEAQHMLRKFDELIEPLATTDTVWFERMMYRPGQGAGNVNELINVMIGMLVTRALAHKCRTFPVTPATWKNHYRRQRNVEGEFSMVTRRMAVKQPKGSPTKTKMTDVVGVLDGQPGAAKLTPHEGDAIGIASYGWMSMTGVEVIGQVLR